MISHMKKHMKYYIDFPKVLIKNTLKVNENYGNDHQNNRRSKLLLNQTLELMESDKSLIKLTIYLSVPLIVGNKNIILSKKLLQ